MRAYIWNNETKTSDYANPLELESKEVDAPWSGRTQSGYGGRLPTQYMVRYNGKWRRVYCALYSNIGTLYVGKRGAWELVIG